jgi:hypothetical protein
MEAKQQVDKDVEITAKSSGKNSFKSFADLKKFLRESGKDIDLVYKQIKFGAVFWIPDCDSDIGGSGSHPWIVISDYKPGTPVITACLRTSSNLKKNSKRGLSHPCGILASLDRDGIILVNHRRSFKVKDFRDFEYGGQLPEVWIQRIKDYMSRGHSK